MGWKIGKTQSRPDVAREMLRLACTGPGDVVYDLGCGEGTILLAAAQLGAKAVGVEICPDLLTIAAQRIAVAELTERIQLKAADLHATDFSDATVLTLYLVPSFLEELRPKLRRLRPGTRIVSQTHDIGDWTPDKVVKVNGRILYLWTIREAAASPPSSVLAKTLHTLFLNYPAVRERRIRRLQLRNECTIVELDDLSVGVSDSDYALDLSQLERIRHYLSRKLNNDPLLLSATEDFAIAGGIAGSIYVAVLSALSLYALAQKNPAYATLTEFPRQFAENARKVVLVGFSKSLTRVILDSSVACSIHISELRHFTRRPEIETELARIKPRGDIQISSFNGNDLLDRIRDADLVAITDSILPTGLLDGLLPACAKCKSVLLYGQSLSLYPLALFDSGVHLISATMNNHSLSNNTLRQPPEIDRRMAETSLPIYLTPRNLPSSLFNMH